MTADEYAAIPEQQQAFYASLLKQGKIKIEQPSIMKGPWDYLIGKRVCVVVHLTYHLLGTLTNVFQYELVLNNGQYVIMKHAIKSVFEIPPDCNEVVI